VTTVKTSFLIFVLGSRPARRKPKPSRAAARLPIAAGRINDEARLRKAYPSFPFSLLGLSCGRRGSIGIWKKVDFIIDTGTYPSVIDQKIAMALRLKEK